jgi:hypothetical protein
MKSVLMMSPRLDLAELRKRELEQSNFRVYTASNESQALGLCASNSFLFSIIGNTYSPHEKRRLAKAIRQHCSTLIVEIYTGTPSLDEAEFKLHFKSETELQETLMTLAQIIATRT